MPAQVEAIEVAETDMVATPVANVTGEPDDMEGTCACAPKDAALPPHQTVYWPPDVSPGRSVGS